MMNQRTARLVAVLIIVAMVGSTVAAAVILL